MAEAVADPMQRDVHFRALFDSHYRPMVQVALRIVDNAAEAEEIVQDAFADLYGRWPSVLNPIGYLRTSVVNGARRVLRRRIHRDELHQRIGALRAGDSDHQYVLDMLNRLPERQRTALILAYYGDFTRREIADALDCREGTAKSLVSRGLARLRKELERG